MTAPHRVAQPATAQPGAGQPGAGQPPGRGASGGALILLLTSAASFMVILDALACRAVGCRVVAATDPTRSLMCAD